MRERIARISRSDSVLQAREMVRQRKYREAFAGTGPRFLREPGPCCFHSLARIRETAVK